MKFGKKKRQPGVPMRNTLSYHNFQPVDGYDPEQDGPDQQWGRIGVECATCGEYRRIGASIEQVNLTGGCIRGGTKRWLSGDWLVVPGDYGDVLESFDGELPDGRVATHSLGNTGPHIWYKDEVRPYTGMGTLEEQKARGRR